MAEQYKEQHRQQETEWEKLEEEASEQQDQIVTLSAHSETDLNRLQEKKRVKAEKQKFHKLKQELAQRV
jgi:ribosome-binding ATPase YchF (GTP1/OBG family)